VTALLFAPSGAPLGEPRTLSVRSTALGRIGVIITVVAAVALALALLRRFWLRYRKDRAGRPAAAQDAPV
jgi:hypothetical protein